MENEEQQQNDSGSENLEGLKSALAKERASNKELKATLSGLQEQVGQFGEIKSQLEEAKGIISEFKTKQQEGAGDFEGLYKAAQERLVEQQSVFEKKTKEAEEKYKSLYVDSSIAREIAEAGGIPELLMPIVKNSVTLVQNDDNISLVVKEGDKFKTDEQGAPLGLKSHLNALKKHEVYSKCFTSGAVRGSGTLPASASGAGNIENPWSESQYNETKQNKILRENPELAELLKKQARD